MTCGLVVQALHDTSGNHFLRPEVVEDQFPVLAKRSSDLLHGLDAGTHGLTVPLIEKPHGPGGRAVIPELLECFLEKVSPDGLQVVAEEITQSEALLGIQNSLSA